MVNIMRTVTGYSDILSDAIVSAIYLNYYLFANMALHELYEDEAFIYL